ESLRLMAAHDVTWTALAYAAEQQHVYSTEVPLEGVQVGDDEIVGAIRAAHALGLRVCLKPVVNVADGSWRAHIGFFEHEVRGEPSRAGWFAFFTLVVMDAAGIAEAEGCAVLCMGCEMVRSDAQEQHWRELVTAVRGVYSGLVTYNCDKYQED